LGSTFTIAAPTNVPTATGLLGIDIGNSSGNGSALTISWTATTGGYQFSAVPSVTTLAAGASCQFLFCYAPSRSIWDVVQRLA
jgi:hypothetical protein